MLPSKLAPAEIPGALHPCVAASVMQGGAGRGRKAGEERERSVAGAGERGLPHGHTRGVGTWVLDGFAVKAELLPPPPRCCPAPPAPARPWAPSPPQGFQSPSPSSSSTQPSGIPSLWWGAPALLVPQPPQQEGRDSGSELLVDRTPDRFLQEAEREVAQDARPAVNASPQVPGLQNGDDRLSRGLIQELRSLSPGWRPGSQAPRARPRPPLPSAPPYPLSINSKKSCLLLLFSPKNPHEDPGMGPQLLAQEAKWGWEGARPPTKPDPSEPWAAGQVPLQAKAG